MPVIQIVKAISLAAAFCVVASARAHKLQVATTHIETNTRAQQVEIMHRFHLHDAQEYMQARGLAEADLVTSQEARSRFSRYVADTFLMRDAQRKQTLILELIGAEIEGSQLWVYQALPLAKLPGAVDLESRFFHSEWPAYRSEIYWEVKGRAQRFVTHAENPRVRVDLYIDSEASDTHD